MKLNNNIKGIALGALALSFASCSNIEDGDRLIDVEVATAKRCVLIEDFTGQYCNNCPKASIIIEELADQYGHDNIVAVGLHGGPFSYRHDGVTPLPLHSPEADYLYKKFGADSQPSGMIDRQGVNNVPDTWGAIVNQRIQLDADLNFDITTTFDRANNTATVSVTVDAILDVNGNLNVWLTEDGIVSAQIMPDGEADRNYVHNHVFRKNITPIDGQPIGVGFGMKQNYDFSIAIDEAWVAENMTVVVFVDNKTGVLQAGKAKLVSE